MVGTRLRYEMMIRDSFPQIRYLRVYSPGGFEVTIYVADENRKLSEEIKRELEHFLRENGSAVCRHIVKPYSMVEVDQVPPDRELPKEIQKAALTGGLNAAGIKASVETVFPFLKIDIVTVEFDTVIFKLSDEVKLTTIEKQLIDQYLCEILPIGTKPKLE